MTPPVESTSVARAALRVATWRRRRLALAIVGIVTIGLLAYAVAWHVVAARFEAEALAWIERQRTAGVHIDYATVTTSGFPGAVRLLFEAPAVARRIGDQRWSWRGERTVVATSLLAPGSVSVDLAGEQAIEGGSPARERRFRGHARVLGATIRVERRPHVHIRAEGLGLTATDGETLAADAVALERRPLTAEGGGPDEALIRATLDRVVLPQGLDLPLGREVQRLTLEARAAGRLDGPTVAAALAAWRRAGGLIDVQRLDADYGPLSLRADGRIALDDDDQPEAALSASLIGLGETIDALVASGLVPRRNAGMLKAVVSAVGRSRGPGAPPEVRVPLTIKKRVLSVGPVAVFEMPVIRWPAANGSAAEAAPGDG